jgi:hypothetical protein
MTFVACICSFSQPKANLFRDTSPKGDSSEGPKIGDCSENEGAC